MFDEIRSYPFCLFFVGFNVETVEYKNISFTVWDVGGQVSPMQKKYFLRIYYYFYLG